MSRIFFDAGLVFIPEVFINTKKYGDGEDRRPGALDFDVPDILICCCLKEEGTFQCPEKSTFKYKRKFRKFVIDIHFKETINGLLL